MVWAVWCDLDCVIWLWHPISLELSWWGKRVWACIHMAIGITWTKLLRPSLQEFVSQLWERRLGISSHSSETNLGWKSWERGSSFLSGHSHKLFVACIRVVRWQESEPSGTSRFSSLKICYNQSHNSQLPAIESFETLHNQCVSKQIVKAIIFLSTQKSRVQVWLYGRNNMRIEGSIIVSVP